MFNIKSDTSYIPSSAFIIKHPSNKWCKSVLSLTSYHSCSSLLRRMAPATFILSDVRIFTGSETIEAGYVVVKNGVIEDVSAGIPPAGLVVISKPGHTILPGFIDAHIHADKGQELALYQSLKFGVTTVMDMHNETANVHKLKKLAYEKKNEASDFKAAGVAATIDGGWPMPVVTAHDKSEEV